MAIDPIFANYAGLYKYEKDLGWQNFTETARPLIFEQATQFRLLFFCCTSKTFVVNTLIWPGIAFQKIADYFVQIRLENGIFGLSFEQDETATKFVEAIQKCVTKTNELDNETFDLTQRPDHTLSHRDRVIKELWSTEKTYVTNLQVLIRLLSLLKGKKHANTFSEEERKKIFQNIELISPLNESFITELTEILSKWGRTKAVGDLLQRWLKFFKIYTDYCNNYEQAIACLQKIEKRKDVSSFLKACDTETQGLKITALLIMPVQRIPRYVLLIKEFNKHTPENHPDSTAIGQALKQAAEITGQTNENVRSHEQGVRFLEMANNPKKYIGFGSLPASHRHLISDMECTIQVGLLEKTYNWMLLLSDLLVFASIDKKGVRTLEETIQLEYVWVEETTDVILKILTPSTFYRVQYNSKAEKDLWELRMQQAIEAWIAKKELAKGDIVRSFEFEFTDRKYKGDWQDALPHGEGYWNFYDERKSDKTELATYSGFWVKGKFDGQGKITYKNGDYYDGSWKMDQYDGYGTLCSRGSIYEGNWIKGKRHGKGTLKWPNGDAYSGDFVNGNIEGEGTFVSGDKKVEYIGQWRENMFHGKGTLAWFMGAYDGEWVTDIKNGSGTLVYANGDIYSGEWKNDAREGYGVFENANKKLKYEGNWAKNVYDGKGKLTIEGLYTYDGDWVEEQRNGKGVMTWNDGTKYEGEWMKGLRAGQGTQYYIDGSKYEGQFFNDMKGGQGKMSYSNNASYVGSWLRDKRHGPGVHTWADGSIYDGAWESDKRNGKGKFTSADGQSYNGSWKDDVRHGTGIQVDVTGTFEGEWTFDQRTGPGKHTNTSGVKYVGNWKQNQYDTTGTLSWENDPITTEFQWREGALEKPSVKHYAPLLPHIKTIFKS
eukprot:TRINITY_DN1148_c0_g1_i1.p1 TRINITY_DN1148_c0_g1~~TRINITY_DN1148_c0_g1_i1.p1  ORF type:complete len:886 (-),score=402.98 TRINITY_DN1148_c0_g1_i1:64-2721(-)